MSDGEKASPIFHTRWVLRRSDLYEKTMAALACFYMLRPFELF
ncbi:hypothetical protein Holit_01054 [Hollandina sp. SP2]